MAGIKFYHHTDYNELELQEKKKQNNKLIEICFKKSKILKRQADRVVMYYNMPAFLISFKFVPTMIFPQKSSTQKFPDMNKLIDYFTQSKQSNIPNLIIFQAESLNEEDSQQSRFVFAAFSNNSWTKKLIIKQLLNYYILTILINLWY